jgi:hypothetical protein
MEKKKKEILSINDIDVNPTYGLYYYKNVLETNGKLDISNLDPNMINDLKVKLIFENFTFKTEGNELIITSKN